MFFLQVIFVLIFCIGGFLWWWQRSARLYWERNGVSYIPGPPFIGVLKDLLQFKKSFGDLFLDLYNHEECKDEPIIGVYFFHKPTLIIRHPEIIKRILIKDFPDFADRTVNPDINDKIGRDNLFSVKGDHWKTIRSKLSPVFTTGKLKNFFHLMVDVTKVLEQKLRMEIGNQPREYEVKDLSSDFTVDTIAICVFGVQDNSLLNPNGDFHKNVNKMFLFTWKRALDFCLTFFLPELTTLCHISLIPKETNDFIRSLFNHVMEERIKSGMKRNDLIDILISMRKQDSELFNGDTLVAQAAVFLVAGYETSSSTIAFAMYELARHPEIQEKLRKEIEDYIEKYGSLQFQTIHEMEYLHNVIQETLRLYPSLLFLDRICCPSNGSESYSLEPYHNFAIPRGMSVYIPITAIQRDPIYFQNPLEFKPERFSAENRDSFDHNNFLAFGIGPRSCIGSRFGYLQVKLALITILRNYRIEATERTPKTIKFHKKSFGVSSEKPLYVNLRRI